MAFILVLNQTSHTVCMIWAVQGKVYKNTNLKIKRKQSLRRQHQWGHFKKKKQSTKWLPTDKVKHTKTIWTAEIDFSTWLTWNNDAHVAPLISLILHQHHRQYRRLLTQASTAVPHKWLLGLGCRSCCFKDPVWNVWLCSMLSNTHWKQTNPYRISRFFLGLCTWGNPGENSHFPMSELILYLVSRERNAWNLRLSGPKLFYTEIWH